MSEPCAIYRHYDADGSLLYVGITNCPKRRLAEHKCRAAWRDEIADVSVKWVPSREEAEAAERTAIATEGPIFNGGNAGEFVPTGDEFRDWLGRTGLTQTEIAKAYGVSRSTLSQMVLGQRKATLRFACFIEDMSDGAVPPRYWLFGATIVPHKNSVGLADQPTAQAS